MLTIELLVVIAITYLRGDKRKQLALSRVESPQESIQCLYNLKQLAWATPGVSNDNEAIGCRPRRTWEAQGF